VNLQQEIRVGEARLVLAQLGFPAQQTNERSALVLLCLLELPADKPWSSASLEFRDFRGLRARR
jgi:hypothetical protein